MDDTSAGAAPTHLPSLTSLRWVAASAVFLRHAGLGAHLGAQGATGVSFFFILSGFVLTWSYRRHRTTRDFLLRRVARIYPNYAIVTLAVIPLYFIVGRFNDAGQAIRGIFTLTLLQSWVPSPDFYFAGNSVSWSLANEAFFYLAFPLFAFAAFRWAAKAESAAAWAGALILAGIVIPWAFHPSGEAGFAFWFIYINPAFRLIEFAIGILLAILVMDGRLPRLPLLPIIGLATLAYLAAGWVPMWAMWSATTLIPYSLLIVAAAQADVAGQTNRVLGNRTLMKLGTWSFAFYLVHEAVITVVRSISARTGLAPPAISTAVVSYCIAVAISAALYKAVEQPGQRWLTQRLS